MKYEAYSKLHPVYRNKLCKKCFTHFLANQRRVEFCPRCTNNVRGMKWRKAHRAEYNEYHRIYAIFARAEQNKRKREQRV